MTDYLVLSVNLCDLNNVDTGLRSIEIKAVCQRVAKGRFEYLIFFDREKWTKETIEGALTGLSVSIRCLAPEKADEDPKMTEKAIAERIVQTNWDFGLHNRRLQLA
ncbi:hypothetical protein HN512_00295 [Candidatus Peregrinibacteria bacterium]|jgi:hypothetical protein|nr:hypothetical protein [Candidatus Peregrinibacteria bacterium]MBT3598266.1 hypothetical protein [Candidatus Peregrinibacteria bacterium]MBT6731333.1 hypothetical protein [Candidatus Peregrinibacteria bacterium]MBT7009702.1 hypothetical protein [Candidatus Peregrinibacteria bacterium]MBT7930075.1 hypothetical protein [Candidatus Peregrinibacteria bacterium]